MADGYVRGQRSSSISTGFEGPLDLLLDLARAHKVDLGRISILDLAEQFLAYLRRHAGPRSCRSLPNIS